MSELREDLKAYLDGELSPARAREVAEALALDPGLAAELEAIRRLTVAVSSEEPIPVKGYEETVLRLRESRRPVSTWSGRWVAGAVAGVACLAIGWVVVRPLAGLDSAAVASADAAVASSLSKAKVAPAASAVPENAESAKAFAPPGLPVPEDLPDGASTSAKRWEPPSTAATGTPSAAGPNPVAVHREGQQVIQFVRGNLRLELQITSETPEKEYQARIRELERLGWKQVRALPEGDVPEADR